MGHSVPVPRGLQSIGAVPGRAKPPSIPPVGATSSGKVIPPAPAASLAALASSPGVLGVTMAPPAPIMLGPWYGDAAPGGVVPEVAGHSVPVPRGLQSIGAVPG